MKLFKKQSKYSFLQIKELLLKSINEYNLEAELSIWFKDKPDEYMITIYNDFCTFQRCGNKMLSNTFKTLDELYKSQQMDNIILQRDWNKIIKFESYDFEIFGLWKHSKKNNNTDRKKQHSLEKYMHKNKVCSDDIYRNYKEFLEVLYNNGYKVTDILWFDYCKIDEQDKSLGSGGFIDKENKDYMWSETQMWDDNLENKSLSELLEHIDMTIKKYPNNNLVPSFYYKINDEKWSDKNFAFNDCSLGGPNKYYNHVAWCPFCDQGWVDIVKDIKTGALFCSCTECETEWDEPSTIKNGKETHNKYGMITYPNEEEIDNIGWKKYIIKMNLNDFCTVLTKIFPEKNEKLLNHQKEYGEILGHVFLGDEFGEVLYKLLIENENIDLIKSYIEFIELMYAQGDDEVLNILDVTILERLSDSPKVWNRLSKYISNSLKEYINNDLLVNNIMMSHVSKLK